MHASENARRRRILSRRPEGAWSRCRPNPRYHHIDSQYVIRIPDRALLRRELAERGIGTEVYYPVPFHLQQCFADLGYARGAFPHAEAPAASRLAVPIYPRLTEAQQAAVVEDIVEALGR